MFEALDGGRFGLSTVPARSHIEDEVIIGGCWLLGRGASWGHTMGTTQLAPTNGFRIIRWSDAEGGETSPLENLYRASRYPNTMKCGDETEYFRGIFRGSDSFLCRRRERAS